MHALEQFLGSPADLSTATVTRLTKRWQGDYTAFQKRDLSASDHVYVRADGVHPKDRQGQVDSCVPVLMSVRPDSHKELIALAEGLRQSTEFWAGPAGGQSPRPTSSPSSQRVPTSTAANSSNGPSAAQRRPAPSG